MNEPWQQPVRPLEYCFRDEERPAGWSPFLRVLFIRPTAFGFQVMGTSGVVWDWSAVIIRWVD